jgi:hypothetical protein
MRVVQMNPVPTLNLFSELGMVPQTLPNSSPFIISCLSIYPSPLFKFAIGLILRPSWSGTHDKAPRTLHGAKEAKAQMFRNVFWLMLHSFVYIFSLIFLAFFISFLNYVRLRTTTARSPCALASKAFFFLSFFLSFIFFLTVTN